MSANSKLREQVARRWRGGCRIRSAERARRRGSSHRGPQDGHCWTAGAVKRLLGVSRLTRPRSRSNGCPFQSISRRSGRLSVLPSHQTCRQVERDVGVDRVAAPMVAIAFGLVRAPVPGATPKNPASGLMA